MASADTPDKFELRSDWRKNKLLFTSLLQKFGVLEKNLATENEPKLGGIYRCGSDDFESCPVGWKSFLF